jgi:hypothetical protein
MRWCLTSPLHQRTGRVELCKESARAPAGERGRKLRLSAVVVRRVVEGAARIEERSEVRSRCTRFGTCSSVWRDLASCCSVALDFLKRTMRMTTVHQRQRLTAGVSIFPFPLPRSSALSALFNLPSGPSLRPLTSFAEGEPACSSAWRFSSSLDRRLLFLRGMPRIFRRGIAYIAR